MQSLPRENEAEVGRFPLYLKKDRFSCEASDGMEKPTPIRDRESHEMEKKRPPLPPSVPRNRITKASSSLWRERKKETFRDVLS